MHCFKCYSKVLIFNTCPQEAFRIQKQMIHTLFAFHAELSCVQLWLDINHCFRLLLKMFTLVCIFTSERREFHSFAPLKVKLDSTKDVLHFGSTQSPLTEALVEGLREHCRLTRRGENSGDTWLFKRLENNFKHVKFTIFSKLKRWGLWIISQWCHLSRFLSNALIVCLYSEVTG